MNSAKKTSRNGIIIFKMDWFDVSVFAADENPGNDSSLSGIQVIGGLALLLLVIFLPLVKGAAKEKRI